MVQGDSHDALTGATELGEDDGQELGDTEGTLVGK